MYGGELVDQVAEAADVTTKDADLVLQTALGNIVEALRRGAKVELRGFGSFRLLQRGARRCHNPRTGCSVDVPPKLVPCSKPSKSLKALIKQHHTDVLPQPGVRPCEWTGSCRGFDRARSVLILELHRAQIA